MHPVLLLLPPQPLSQVPRIELVHGSFRDAFSRAQNPNFQAEIANLRGTRRTGCSSMARKPVKMARALEPVKTPPSLLLKGGPVDLGPQNKQTASGHDESGLRCRKETLISDGGVTGLCRSQSGPRRGRGDAQIAGQRAATPPSDCLTAHLTACSLSRHMHLTALFALGAVALGAASSARHRSAPLRSVFSAPAQRADASCCIGRIVLLRSIRELQANGALMMRAAPCCSPVNRTGTRSQNGRPGL
jgi:hypothetical protein